MPPPLYLQTDIAFIWDFDKTLSPSYMQAPLFEHFNVDEQRFWAEVNALVSHYAERGLSANKDTVYLGHILTYIREGKFPGLTNELLRELGAKVPLAPGIPAFMQRSRDLAESTEKYKANGIKVEHYIVSTGLRQMIMGNPIHEFVDGVWACELLSDPPGQGFLDNPPDPESRDGILTQVGYALDNTTKTRAIFEINKGVNKRPEIDVNSRMSEDQRRVPIQNMIYIADGPSDVPVFSVVGGGGGKTLGVYTGPGNFDGVRSLEDDGRVGSTALADYSEGTAADLWLMSSLKKIADGICARREQGFAAIPGVAGHVT